MNRNAYALGVVYVFLTMAAAVVARSYSEALFLQAYSVKWLPHFFLASALAFGAAAVAYDLAARRVPGALLDGVLITLLGGAAAIAPWAVTRGGASVFVMALVLIGLSSVANLAAWNGVASAVAGRTARRWLPRAGAAVTFGGVVAGFGSRAIIQNAGILRLPNVVLALSFGMLACGIALGRSLTRGGAPGAPAVPPPPAGAKPAAQGLRGDARTLIIFLTLAAILEAAVSTFIEFRWSAELKSRWSGQRLGEVIATFYGATSAVLLVLQVLAAPRLLVTKSLPFTVSVHPTLILAGIAAVLVQPGFLLLSSLRTGDNVFRAATSRAGQEVSLSVLGPADRPRWKLLLRGVATPVGAALAAGVMLALPGLGLRALFGVALALSFVWLLVVRKASRAFLATLATPLGMREAVKGRASAEPLDLAELARVTELAGSADRRAARIARAALAGTGRKADELAPELTHERAEVRAALFAMAARRPDPSAAGEIRTAFEFETDERALAGGFRAMAAHGQRTAVAAAEQLRSSPGDVGLAARAYLAEIGTVPPDQRLAIARELFAVDGAWAAAVCRAALVAGDVTAEAIDRELLAVLDGPSGRARRETWETGLAAGGEAFFARYLAALEAGDRDAIAATQASSVLRLERLERLLKERRVAVAARAHLARALRAWSAPDARRLLTVLLADPDLGVRLAAARSLAHARAGLSADAVSEAIERELDVFAGYLAARAKPGVHGALPALELERRTRLALSVLLSVVALAGNASALHAAQRRLLSSSEPARRRALDLLQEVSRGRPQLLELVEAWLATPRAAAVPTAATAALLAQDPWLARVFTGALGALEPRVLALRKSPLYEDLPGEVLGELATHLAEVTAAPGEVIATSGEPGDAMYEVLEGALSVERDGREVTRLGPGQAFGELALLDDAPRNATVRVVAPTRLLRVPRDVVQRMLLRSPELGLGILGTLAGWLRGPR